MSLHRFLFRPLFLLNQSENKMFSLLMKLTLKVDDADPRYSHGNGRYKSCRWLHSNSVCRKKVFLMKIQCHDRIRCYQRRRNEKNEFLLAQQESGIFIYRMINIRILSIKRFYEHWTYTNHLLFWSQVTWSIKMVVEIFGLNYEKCFE